MENDMKPVKVALLFAGLVLCAAIFPFWPYSFYIALRLMVCATCAYTAYQLRHHEKLRAHLLPLFLLGLLFNPFIPAYLTRLIWLPIDLGTALYFLQLSKKL